MNDRAWRAMRRSADGARAPRGFDSWL